MSVRGLRTQLDRIKARLPHPDFCTGCEPVPIIEASEAGNPPLPDEPCPVCGRMRDPSVIRCIVVIRPAGPG
jgi:hypothetical protein